MKHRPQLFASILCVRSCLRLERSHPIRWAARVRTGDNLLFAICPVTRSPPLVRHRDDPKFLGGDLIDDAIRKPTEKIAAPTATKDCSKHGIGQNTIRRPLELGHERKREFDIRSRRIEGRGVMQLGECAWNNNELHFNAART